ncbi:MAG: tetratricopeptide repeat protein [Chloroflexota bacterium]
MKLFRKKRKISEIETLKMDPSAIKSPQTLDDFVLRGWSYHARDMQDKAIEDFRRALELSPHNPDIHYALGLAYRAQGKTDEAVSAFKKVMEILLKDQDKETDSARKEMLRRLALGHVNILTTGDWGLEREVWKKLEL